MLYKIHHTKSRALNQGGNFTIPDDPGERNIALDETDIDSVANSGGLDYLVKDKIN